MTIAYRLIDAGARSRLERFGDRVVDRPTPAATEPPRDPDAWTSTDLQFDRETGWTALDPALLEPWTIELDEVTLELRPTSAGQVGLFPEQLPGLDWLRARVGDRTRDGEPGGPQVLNLFAATGLVSLALAAAGAAVAHVDAARSAVEWARRNAGLSGLEDRPIRWLVDDALTFVRREARRGRRYEGLVLDPPSYGLGTGGGRFQLDRALPELLEACDAVLEPTAFALLTAHTPEFGADRLADELGRALGVPTAWVEPGDLEVRAASGAVLRLGAFARIMGR